MTRYTIDGASKPLTVAALIELLQHVPDKTAPVELEGCDCSALAIGVSRSNDDSDDNVVILRRDRGVFRDDEHRSFGEGEGEIFAATFPVTAKTFVDALKELPK